MEVEQILRVFGIMLGAGLISQLISTFLRIPEMIVLVAVGALIGPSVLGIVSNPLDGAFTVARASRCGYSREPLWGSPCSRCQACC